MKLRSLIVIVSTIFIWTACDKPVEPDIQPVLSSSAKIECKSFLPLKSNDPGPSKSCITYQYDGTSILTLKHFNSAFNCCPEGLIVSLDIKGDTLFITEDDSLELCRCNCLFDIDIEIKDLKQGTYVIKIIEPYVMDTDPQLEFTVDLKFEPTGEFCLTRKFYPWHD